VEGAFRKPTIVNNVETLAALLSNHEEGDDWFKSLGIPPDPKTPRDAGSYGPQAIHHRGHVNKPVCVRMPMGKSAFAISLKSTEAAFWKGRQGKAVNLAGLSMGLWDVKRPNSRTATNRNTDIPLDFNGPAAFSVWDLARQRSQ